MLRCTPRRIHLLLPLVLLAAPALATHTQAPPLATAGQPVVPGESRPPGVEFAQAAPGEPKAPATKGPAAKAAEAKGSESTPAKAEPGPLAPFAWLDGCWRGSVNQREFREHWLPLRGNLMLGVSHTVRGDRTQDYEYLRIETRPDGAYYVNQPSGEKAKENAYKFTGRTLDTAEGRNDEIFTFENPAVEFPSRIIYRRGSEGWLYATVEGKVKHKTEDRFEDHKVIYPMRRIDCQSGEFIRK